MYAGKPPGDGYAWNGTMWVTTMPERMWGIDTGGMPAPPSVAGGGWTAINHNAGTTWTDSASGPTLRTVATRTQVEASVRAMPAASNYDLRWLLSTCGAAEAGGSGAGGNGGICLRESASGKLITMNVGSGMPACELHIARWNGVDVSAFVADVKAASATRLLPTFMRVADDGTTRFYYVSNDGHNWARIYSEARAEFCVPDQWGMAQYPNAGSEILTLIGGPLSVS